MFLCRRSIVEGKLKLADVHRIFPLAWETLLDERRFPTISIRGTKHISVACHESRGAAKQDPLKIRERRTGPSEPRPHADRRDENGLLAALTSYHCHRNPESPCAPTVSLRPHRPSILFFSRWALGRLAAGEAVVSSPSASFKQYYFYSQVWNRGTWQSARWVP